VGDQPFESLEVELARLDSQQITGRARHQSGLVRRYGVENLAEPPDLVSECVLGRVHALLDKELVDQSLARDDAIRAEKQQRQQRTLLRTTERDGRAVQLDSERPQDPKIEPAVLHRSGEVSSCSGLRTRGRDRSGTTSGPTLGRLGVCSTRPNASGPASPRTTSVSRPLEPKTRSETGE